VSNVPLLVHVGAALAIVGAVAGLAAVGTISGADALAAIGTFGGVAMGGAAVNLGSSSGPTPPTT
jgi:hypothetical protein